MDQGKVSTEPTYCHLQHTGPKGMPGGTDRTWYHTLSDIMLQAKETLGTKLFTSSRKRSLKNPRAASTDAKNERGVEISVAWENPAQYALSKFQREEPERGEG